MRKLGIAPIGWTNDDMPELGFNISFEKCISQMHEAGYTGTEVGNKYPKNPKSLKERLWEYNLQIVNKWVSLFLITKSFEENFENFKKEIDFLYTVGAKNIGVSEQSYSIQGIDVPILENNKHIMNDNEWKILCEGLNKLGEYSLSKGISLVFHHHMGTVIQSAAETDKLLEMTNPKFVSLLYDTGHFAFCNEDPLKCINKYIKRVKHVHLKDIRKEKINELIKEKYSFLTGVKNGVFTVPGDGEINFEPIFNVLKNNNYNRWLLVEAEQDPAKAKPLKYAKIGYSYIDKLLKKIKWEI